MKKNTLAWFVIAGAAVAVSGIGISACSSGDDTGNPTGGNDASSPGNDGSVRDSSSPPSDSSTPTGDAGCGVAAVYPWALLDQRTVMLEPFCAVFCMLGLVAAFDGDRITPRRGRLASAGVAFGMAGSCKAFAVLPLIAVVAVLLLGGPSRLRRLAPLLGGAAGTFLLICAPFLVLAPRQFFHQVVATQIGRSQKVEPKIWDRAFSLIGLLPATGRDPRFADDSHPADLILIAVLAALILGGWLVRRRIAQLDLVAVGVVIVTAIGLAEPPAYYDHYAAFFGPFLGVPLGLAAGHLGRRLPRLVAVAAAAAVVAGGVHAVHVVQAQPSRAYAAAVLDAAVPAGACVVSDDAAVLVLADRFTSRVAGCSQLVDTYGTTISSDGGYSPRSSEATHSPAVAAWRQVFAHADYVVLTQRNYSRVRIPWNGSLRRYLQQHFRTVVSEPLTVLARRSSGGRGGAAGP